MRQRLRTVFTALFAVALAAFLMMGIVLVLAQIGGLVLAQPEMITGVKDLLIRPAISCAIIAGVFAFVVFSAQETAPSPG